MKVTTVTANIRYSQDTGHGAWKVVELGAEASVGQQDSWTEAQAALYQQLGCQLKALWANGTGNKTQDGIEKPVEPSPEPIQTPAHQPQEHFCQEHHSPFKQHHRGDSVWYSHKTSDGKRCREK